MGLPTLRDFRGDTIEMVCHRCDRYGSYDREELVKKLGAKTEFVELRRIMAIGCDRRGTHQCEAKFPCLLAANISIEAPK